MNRCIRWVGALFLAVQTMASFTDAAIAEDSRVDTVGPDQSTATLKETLDWLRVKTPEFATFTDSGCPGQGTQTFEWLELKACDEWSFQMRDNQGKLSIVSTFSPRTLNGSSISLRPTKAIPDCVISPYSVDVDTIGGAKSVYYQVYSDPSQIAGTNFVAVDHESAERLAKAIKHAIRLCGSKKEPF
jgi:hypothetical protein